MFLPPFFPLPFYPVHDPYTPSLLRSGMFFSYLLSIIRKFQGWKQFGMPGWELWMFDLQCIYPFIWYLDCFHFLAVRNEAAESLHTQLCMDPCFLWVNTQARDDWIIFSHILDSSKNWLLCCEVILYFQQQCMVIQFPLTNTYHLSLVYHHPGGRGEGV